MHIWLADAYPEYYADTHDLGVFAIEELLFNRNVFTYEGDYGTQGAIAHGMQYTGHSTGDDPVLAYAEPGNYFGYNLMDLINLWIAGKTPTFPEQFGVPVGRSMSQYLYNTDEGLANDMLDDMGPTIGRMYNSDGDYLDMEAASDYGFSDRSASNAISRCNGMMMAFDTSDDAQETHYFGDYGDTNWGLMGSSSSFYGTNPFSQPKVLSPHLGLLLKQVGAKNWSLDEDAGDD